MNAVCRALVLVALAAVPAAQDVRAVPLHVVVTTTDGRLVEDLAATDFSVRLDGQPVSVLSSVVRTRALPLLILIDVSASWAHGQGDDTLKLLRTDILELRRDDEPVRVMGFGRYVRDLGPFTTNTDAQEKQVQAAFRIPEEERSGPSPLWDVLDASLGQGPEGQAFDVWMITDGQATGNRLRLSQVADRAIAANVAVHTLFVGSSGQLAQQKGTALMIRPQVALQQLSRATGGLFVERTYSAPVSFGNVRTLPNQTLPNPLREATLALRRGYQLTVAAPVREGFQRVEVSTRDAGHHVRARLGLVSSATAR